MAEICGLSEREKKLFDALLIELRLIDAKEGEGRITMNINNHNIQLQVSNNKTIQIKK